MKLKKIKIKAFGALSDIEFTFKDRLNVIYGPNESGKSTLQAFIKAMLYGQRKGKMEGVTEKEKYKPWYSDAYGGSLEYELINSNKYRVWRDFNTGQTKIFDYELNEITDEFSHSRNGGVLFAEEQLGVDKELFTTTAFVSQLGVRLDSKGEAIISDRIEGIIETGSERISFKTAKDILEKTLLNEIGTDRTGEKPLNKIKFKIKQLEDKKKKYKAVLNRIRELEVLLYASKDNEIKLSNEYKYAKALRDTKETHEKYKQGKQEYENKEELEKQLKQKNDYIQRINKNIPGEIAIFDQEIANGLLKMENKILRFKNNKRRLLIIALIAILTGVGITISFPKLLLIGETLCFCGITCGLISISINKMFNNIKNEINDILTTAKVDNVKQYMNKKEEIFQAVEKTALATETIQVIKNQLTGLKGNDEKCRKFEQKNIFLQTAYENIIDKKGIPEIQSLKNSSLEEINNYFEDCNNKLREVQLEIKEIETEIKMLTKDTEKLPEIEEELQLVKLKEKELKEFEYCIKQALNILENCSGKIKEGIIPQLTNHISGISKNITDKYDNIKIVDKAGIKISLSDGKVVPISYLSEGTIDQLYFAIRLGMSEIISQNKEFLPLIMDEVFSQYDNTRMKSALKYIKNICCNKQVILFTCREDEVRAIKNIIPQANMLYL